MVYWPLVESFRPCPLWTLTPIFSVEARAGIEPAHTGFANQCITTLLPRQALSAKIHINRGTGAVNPVKMSLACGGVFVMMTIVMSPLFYQFLHVTGVLLLFTSVGAFLAGPQSGARKFAGMLHGIGLLLLLVAGFGLMAKKFGVANPMSFPAWAWAKVVVWLVLGALPAVVNRGKLAPKGGVLLGLVLGLAAAWLAIFKPF